MEMPAVIDCTQILQSNDYVIRSPNGLGSQEFMITNCAALLNIRVLFTGP